MGANDSMGSGNAKALGSPWVHKIHGPAGDSHMRLRAGGSMGLGDPTGSFGNPTSSGAATGFAGPTGAGDPFGLRIARRGNFNQRRHGVRRPHGRR